MNNNLTNPNNQLTNKLAGLPLTGTALIGFSASSLVLLAINKLMPMLDGSFQAEMLPGVEGAVLTGVMALFGVVMGIFALMYILAILLGINAIRFSKKPESVKARTGLAKFLIVGGVASVLVTAFSVAEGSSFSEVLQAVLPDFAIISFVVSYLVEVKAVKEVTKTVG